jgi:hypothetical protein
MSKTIMEMAREAGICTWLKPPPDVVERIERFAALVRADEREACAKVCESFDLPLIAEAIRERGQT